MNKSILIISGGESSWGMARTIRNMGYKVAIASTPGNDLIRENSDFYLETSENNVQSVVDFAKKHNVAGIVPVPVDKILWWQSSVAEILELPFIKPENILNFRNKFIMKQVLKREGILCANGVLIKKGDEVLKITEGLLYPLIVKPTDGYASRGVTRVDDPKALIKYIDEAFSFSIDGDIVVEEFIKGREFNAEGVCCKGKVIFHAIIEKVSGPFPRTLEMGHLIPADITHEEEKEILTTVEKAVLALGLENGGFNTEIKLFDGKGYIIEVNGRLAGDFIVSHLLKPVTGRDMEEDIVNISLGRDIKLEPLTYLHHGYISFFNLPEYKKIIKIKTPVVLLNNPDVIWWKIFFKEGEITPDIRHMGNRAGFVIVKGKSRSNVIKKAEKYIDLLINSIELK